MKICAHKQVVGLAALLVVVALSALSADEPARSRGAAINFSAPQSDAVSTNLNDLRTPTSPFQNLEATLKSPFQSLEKPAPSQSFRDNRKFHQQNQTLNRKPLKDQLNKRAEAMFLNPELFEGDEGDDAFFQLSKDSLDPYQKKPKNSLERYNVRQERDRMVLTNQAGAKNLLGAKAAAQFDAERPDANPGKPLGIGGYADDLRNVPPSVFPRAATNSSLSSERSVMARTPEGYSRPFEDPMVRRRSDADTRMEDFKRLLGGSRYTPPPTSARSSGSSAAANFGVTTAGNNASSHTTPAPTSISEWSAFKKVTKEDDRNDFATSAGLVGRLEKPHGLQEFPAATKALAPVTTATMPEPTPVKKVVRSTFKVPQRRF
jgi:hypothetical protein